MSDTSNCARDAQAPDDAERHTWKETLHRHVREFAAANTSAARSRSRTRSAPDGHIRKCATAVADSVLGEARPLTEIAVHNEQ